MIHSFWVVQSSFCLTCLNRLFDVILKKCLFLSNNIKLWLLIYILLHLRSGEFSHFPWRRPENFLFRNFEGKNRAQMCEFIGFEGVKKTFSKQFSIFFSPSLMYPVSILLYVFIFFYSTQKTISVWFISLCAFNNLQSNFVYNRLYRSNSWNERCWQQNKLRIIHMKIAALLHFFFTTEDKNRVDKVRKLLVKTT